MWTAGGPLLGPGRAEDSAGRGVGMCGRDCIIAAPPVPTAFDLPSTYRALRGAAGHLQGIRADIPCIGGGRAGPRELPSMPNQTVITD